MNFLYYLFELTIYNRWRVEVLDRVMPTWQFGGMVSAPGLNSEPINA